jgi:Tfp pilus assembly protein PilV
MNIHTLQVQKGFTLIEALVAFAVVASGLLAIASFQAGLFGNSAYNKARTEALSLAQQKIEEFKHYTHASEDNFIDEDDDGVMDADGNYTDVPIEGQNALFMRSWDLTTGNQATQIDVSVSWVDSANEAQSIFLTAAVPWISPRAGADQINDPDDPVVLSPMGSAKVGDGNLSDYPDAEVIAIGSPSVDGLSTHQYEENLFLTNENDKILLTLEDACSTDTGICTDFVKISGTVYLDTANAKQDLNDIYVIASDAAHCQRWVPSGTLLSPPSTAAGDYEYYNYTCYLGGGWYGNIGFVTSGGIKLSDKVCQGDPTSLDAWEEPVIALRRAYRGMLHRNVSGETRYYSHGIKDATEFTAQDFVFTNLSATATAGSFCVGANEPMTRIDSSAGTLFEGTPVEFVCLNADDNGDQLPDYLDSYDTSTFGADTACPFDPTDPPVDVHNIVGAVKILTAEKLDLSSFQIVTSDGLGNCEWVSEFAAVGDGYEAIYSCSVYDWGSGWSGFVQVQPNSKYLYCPSDTAAYTGITSNQEQHFGCISSKTVAIEGSISLNADSSEVYAIGITDVGTGFDGRCRFSSSAYRCVLPYDGDTVDLTVTVKASDAVCGAVVGELSYYGYSVDGSPYRHDIVIEQDSSFCP